MRWCDCRHRVLWIRIMLDLILFCIANLFPVWTYQRILLHRKASVPKAQESSWYSFRRWYWYQRVPGNYWKEGLGTWRESWEHTLLFALTVASMYYIKYKNNRNWKEISTAQDSGGIKSQMKSMILDPFAVFISLGFSFLYIILYIRYSFPKIHIYSFTG